MANYFEELNNINVNDKVEQKNGLNYLSWAYAWGELKKKHPTANSKVYEREDGRIYFDDGRTAWVKVSITVNDIEHIEYLPIMDNRNQSLPLEKITSFNVNTSIQRALTKAIGRHGLGLYIYAGEDLPENDDSQQEEKPTQEKPKSDFVPMTQTQKDLIIKLLGEKDVIPSKVYETLGIDRKHVSKSQASQLIEFLMKCPPKMKASTTLKEVSSTVNTVEDEIRIEPTINQDEEDDLDNLPF